MNLVLNQKKLLWLGIGVIGLYYFLNKFDFIFHASFTSGIAVAEDVICFNQNKKIYQFNALSGIEYALGEKLQVIFLEENPERAYVFSFTGFWYSGLIICLVPLALWSAFVLAFFNEEDKLFLNLFGKRKSIQFQSDRKKLKK